jgi:hypothetical protein
MEIAAEEQASAAPFNDVPVPSTSVTTMDVDVPVSGEGRTKRKADESPPAEGSKKAKIGEFTTCRFVCHLC